MKKTIIIGGGVSGLAAAFRLFESGNEFVLLEAGDRLGGIIQTIRREGFLLETGPDAFLSEKPEAVRLACRLGIESELLGTRDENRRAFLVYEKSLRPVPEGFQLIAPSNLDAFFNSDILSPRGKVRLANERFLLPEAEKEDESLADFVRRRFGQEALERIAQPMIGGIYTADPEKLSLRATQPRFLELEQKYGSVINGLLKLQSENRNRKPETEGSGARYSLFLSFQNGMETLTNALSARLPQNSLQLLTKAESLSFSETNRLWKVETNNGILEAETVILALPAHISARLLSSQFPALAEKLNSIEHASSATVNLAFWRDQIEHALDGFGFVVPFVEKRTVMACTFSSVKFANRAPENFVLLRAFVGGALQPEMFALTDKEMVAGVLHDLRELLGLKGEPLFSHIARWADSMPQYTIGHLKRVAEIKDSIALIPSLELATTAIDGVGIPDAIRHGEQAADNLLKFWHSD